MVYFSELNKALQTLIERKFDFTYVGHLQNFNGLASDDFPIYILAYDGGEQLRVINNAIDTTVNISLVIAANTRENWVNDSLDIVGKVLPSLLLLREETEFKNLSTEFDICVMNTELNNWRLGNFMNIQVNGGCEINLTLQVRLPRC